MVKFWSYLSKKPRPPSREEVEAVMHREVAEATRLKLERAIEHRRREITSLVEGVIPQREGKTE